MKYLCFVLTMPGCPSWNGKWSGENDFYAIVRKFPKKWAEKAAEILAKGHYSYSWPDGWRAAIEVKEVSAADAKKIEKKSNGFSGYSWMVDSIENVGYITDKKLEL